MCCAGLTVHREILKFSIPGTAREPRIYPMIQALRSLRWWVEPFTLVACALLIVTTGLAHGSAGVGKSVLVLYGERGDLPAIQAIETEAPRQPISCGFIADPQP
jgi:hypothetical protein